MPVPASDRFWTFSLAVYGTPGVAPALIGLQDELGLDVNMLLYCCWAGSEGRRLSRADLKTLDASTQAWQAEVVRPLRSLRRRLKAGFDDLPAEPVAALRRRISEAEIEGERIAQAAMAALLPAESNGDAGRGAVVVAANLQAYLRHSNRTIDGAVEAALRTILQGCCPGESLEQVSFASA